MNVGRFKKKHSDCSQRASRLQENKVEVGNRGTGNRGSESTRFPFPYSPFPLFPYFFGGALISTVLPSIESSISPESARIPCRPSRTSRSTSL